MRKQLRKKGLLICTGIVLFGSIVVLPKGSERGTQGRTTTLHVAVTCPKQGGSDTMPLVDAQVFVKSLAQGQEFQQTVPTDSQGVANVSDVPYGATLIQVTKAGYISSGERFDLNKREQTIKIQLREETRSSPSPSPSPSPNAPFGNNL